MSNRINKIEIKICMGTTCFIMCNSELQEIESELNPALLPYVNIIGSSCLNLCKESKYHKIPCASIDGVLHENINKNELIKRIDNKVREKFLKAVNNGK